MDREQMALIAEALRPFATAFVAAPKRRFTWDGNEYETGTREDVQRCAERVVGYGSYERAAKAYAEISAALTLPNTKGEG